MLADLEKSAEYAGTLDSNVLKPLEWMSSLVNFIAKALPEWRDAPTRNPESNERRLTAQLCSRLNSLARHSPGWDILQFKQEEPDETIGSRSLDLGVQPCDAVISIEGRQYTEYQTLLPIECKRLPTPIASDRDEREYLISQYSSTGGVDRFKQGRHGAAHQRAAMIGYVQENDVDFWRSKVDTWITEIANAPTEGWSFGDKFTLVDHDPTQRLASLISVHERASNLDPIHIDHIWIEM